MPKPPWNKIPIKKDFLNDLYLEKGLSIGSIAKILKVSNNVVHNRLKEFDIRVRSISEAKTIFNITREKLGGLYFEKRWSMDQIANHFDCSRGTIVYKFQKYGLKSRGHLGLRRPIIVDKNQLKQLYHGQNLSLEQIAKHLHCSKGAIERKILKFNIKLRGKDRRKHWRYQKKPYDGSLEEKAYLIGFRLGDLNVYQRKQVIVVRGSTTKPAQAALFERLFANYGGVNTTRAKRGTTEQYAYLDHSFDFLLPKQDKIEPWIRKCSRCCLAFFAGYFDAEGCAHLHKDSRTGRQDGRLEIQSYDKEIICKSWKCLLKLGIYCKRPRIVQKAGFIGSNGVRHNGDSWRLSVWRKTSVWQLSNLLIQLAKHSDKRHSLNLIRNQIMFLNNERRKGRKILDLTIPILPSHTHI